MGSETSVIDAIIMVMIGVIIGTALIRFGWRLLLATDRVPTGVHQFSGFGASILIMYAGWICYKIFIPGNISFLWSMIFG